MPSIIGKSSLLVYMPKLLGYEESFWRLPSQSLRMIRSGEALEIGDGNQYP